MNPNRTGLKEIRRYAGHILYQVIATGKFEVQSIFNWKIVGNPDNEGHGHNMLRDLERHSPFACDNQ